MTMFLINIQQLAAVRHRKFDNPKVPISLSRIASGFEALIYHKNITKDVPIEDLLKARREEILKISAKHGAFNVRVFGSAARGEAGEQSDIDLLVDVGANRTPFFPGGLLADLEDLLGRRVDVVTEEGLHWYIREKVIKEAVPL